MTTTTTSTPGAFTIKTACPSPCVHFRFQLNSYFICIFRRKHIDSCVHAIKCNDKVGSHYYPTHWTISNCIGWLGDRNGVCAKESSWRTFRDCNPEPAVAEKGAIDYCYYSHVYGRTFIVSRFFTTTIRFGEVKQLEAMCNYSADQLHLGPPGCRKKDLSHRIIFVLFWLVRSFPRSFCCLLPNIVANRFITFSFPGFNW